MIFCNYKKVENSYTYPINFLPSYSLVFPILNVTNFCIEPNLPEISRFGAEFLNRTNLLKLKKKTITINT